MARCKIISPPKRKLCIGDLRDQVGLFVRSLEQPNFGKQFNQQVYTLIDTVAAAPQTTNGIDIFDGVNKAGSDGKPTTATIFFFIRFRSDITAENFLRYDGVNYGILRAENIDLRRQWMKLFCATRGDLTLEANL